jgi:hypothetical protein
MQAEEILQGRGGLVAWRVVELKCFPLFLIQAWQIDVSLVIPHESRLSENRK